MTGLVTSDGNRGTEGLLHLRDALRQFAADRDWDQFHSPKNLAMALTVEAAELLEPFQWLKEGSAAELGPERLAAVREEMADVLLYLVDARRQAGRGSARGGAGQAREECAQVPGREGAGQQPRSTRSTDAS